MAELKKVVEVRQDQEKPVPPTVLAEALVKISESIHSLRRGLSDRAIIALIHDSVRSVGRHGKPSKRVIREVLNSLSNLQKIYCR